MPNQQDYAIAFVRAKGVVLSEEASCTMSRASHANMVKTVAKGYAGDTPGGAMCEIDVKNMVPAAGIEFDAGPYIVSLTRIELGIIIAGKTALSTGVIYEDTTQHGVDATADYGFKFRGGFPQYQ